jgi:hypothetical protein
MRAFLDAALTTRRKLRQRSRVVEPTDAWPVSRKGPPRDLDRCAPSPSIPWSAYMTIRPPSLTRLCGAEATCRFFFVHVFRRMGRVGGFRSRLGRPAWIPTQKVTRAGSVRTRPLDPPRRIGASRVPPSPRPRTPMSRGWRMPPPAVLDTARAGRAPSRSSGAPEANLVSLGRYALRGVGRAQELFTLDPAEL